MEQMVQTQAQGSMGGGGGHQRGEGIMSCGKMHAGELERRGSSYEAWQPPFGP